jgi:hypothetical protein
MSALDQPLDTLDQMSELDPNKPLVLTRSFKQFKDFIDKHIHKMTGTKGNPFYGLRTRCRGDECTYELNTHEITGDGNCLFDSFLYMLGHTRRHRDDAVQDEKCDSLRAQLINHYIESGGVSNGTYDLRAAAKDKRSYTPTIIVQSFVDVFKTNVIVFELFNSGEFNAQLFMNRTVPFDHVEFLILTQNPGHYTTFRQERGFEQPQRFLEKLRSVPSDIGGTLGDMMVGEDLAFDDRTYYQPLCYNYEHADTVFSVDRVRGPPPASQRPRGSELRPPLPERDMGVSNIPGYLSTFVPSLPALPHLLPPTAFLDMFQERPATPRDSPRRSPKVPKLEPLLSLNHVYPDMNRLSGLAVGANLEARSGSLSSRTRKALNKAVARSPTISPRTRRALNEAAAGRTPRSESRRSPTISPRTRRALNEAAEGRTPRSESRRSPTISPRTRRALNEAAAGRTPRSESRRSSPRRSPTISPRTRRALNEAAGRTPRSESRSTSRASISGHSKLKNRLNLRRAINVAENASPATKERIAQLALSEAPDASINTMNQIARLGRASRSRSPRARSVSPRRRRFRLSSIVNKHIPRLFGFRR